MRQSPIEITRARLEAKIEELVALLDLIDGDENLEDGGDAEPSIGSPAMLMDGKLEYDLEGDTSDQEYSLGWSNPRFGDNGLPEGWGMTDSAGDGETGSFNGDGHHIARKMLREGIKDQRKLSKAMSATRVSPGYGRYV